jgi:hypothetical protein
MRDARGIIGMDRPSKTRDELRNMILEEIMQHPVCPSGIDVLVREHPNYRWTADVIPPSHVGYADCAHLIGQVVRSLRAKYDLSS